jgi:hypothetical protein
MADVVPIVLGFDFRCCPSGDANASLSVDVNQWEQVDNSRREALRRSAASALNRDEASLISPMDMSVLTCLPRPWLDTKVDVLNDVVVIAFASSILGPSRRAYRVDLASGYYGCDIEYTDLMDAGWVSMGYDVCDDSLSASLLYSGTKGLPGMLAEFSDLQMLLNSNGLFARHESASSFATNFGYLLNEHAPFSAVEILAAGYCNEVL